MAAQRKLSIDVLGWITAENDVMLQLLPGDQSSDGSGYDASEAE